MNSHTSALAPVESVMPALPQTVLIVLFGILIAAALVHALILVRRDGDHRLLLMLGCGAAACLLEGFACHLIQCWHSAIGMIEVYESFSIHIPLWLAELYVLFFGAMPYYFAKRFSKAPTAGVFFGAIAIIGVAEGLAEMFLIHLGMHVYWGAQPFPILGFPLYLGFVNPVLGMVMCWIMTAWFRAVSGPAAYLMILLTPPIMAGIYAGLTYPMSGFLHDGNGSWAAIGSLVSIALSLVVAFLTFQGLLAQRRSLTPPVTTS